MTQKKTESTPVLSSGSTLLNLACSDRPDGAFLPGHYYYLVGDSMSGKTWLSLSCMAEACRNPAFKDYRLIYDDVEGGVQMDLAHYFGKDLVQRLEPPKVDKQGSIYSDTIENFYFFLSDAIKEGRPFIYILDSQDALSSYQSESKFEQHRKEALHQEGLSGSYGDGKAKYHSEHLRVVLQGIRRLGSILIVIGQTRDNLGFGFETKTRSGGRALRFYAHLEIWTSLAGKIKKTVRGKERTVGIRCLGEVKKNRFTGKTGKDRSVEFPIYYGLGIDDVGACVDYLISEKHWTKKTDSDKGKVLDARELLFEGSRAAIIQHIEEEGLEQKLREIVASVWHEIEQECLPHRKLRYG